MSAALLTVKYQKQQATTFTLTSTSELDYTRCNTPSSLSNQTCRCAYLFSL